MSDAARIMWEADCGCVPVVAGDGRGGLVGIITDRDVCMAAYTRGRAFGELLSGICEPRQLRAGE